MSRLIWSFLLICSLLSKCLDARAFGGFGDNRNFRGGGRRYIASFRQNLFHIRSTAKLFSYSPITRTHVIISPASPIIYGDYHYYWEGHHVYTTQKPDKCDYQIIDKDKELRNITFANGTRPAIITFGCAEYTYCCGLECCTGLSQLEEGLFLIGVSLAVLFLAVITVLLDKCKKRTTKRFNLPRSTPEVQELTPSAPNATNKVTTLFKKVVSIFSSRVNYFTRI
ncbi:CX domain-containing protein [Caenorhabditis elegans]|uniref:CX domain-containing protein n=1 Tax=Caenorhabditis elegans TaxID=6239 RepID=Q9TXT5_CAEEL|nr:CX domain-containing protein [Caenorhabditis elegans]CCD67673.1 CX domain-containing protein [Caenorhabditis elegans]|eukprot:NP_494690.2 Uncharacterized protein CELE_F53C3.4 [Caenorhabditis elegans]